MARLPSLVPAETDYAAWMRAYRAFKSGRGANPGPRRVWEDQRAKLRSAEMLSVAEIAWRELRDAVLELGGICANPDYGYDSIPRPVYRVNGKPADLVTVLLNERGGFRRLEVADELICDLWKLFEESKRAREDAA